MNDAARTATVTIVFVLLAFNTITSGSQDPPPGSDLSALTFFLGRWEGTAEGQPGKGTATREYTSQLRSRIIEARDPGKDFAVYSRTRFKRAK